MSKCIRKVRGFQILHYHASLTSSLNCSIKKLQQWTKCYVRVFIISCELWAPHLILPCTYHLAMSSCIILRIALTCIDLCPTFLVCAFWFFSSRRRRRAVRAGVRAPSGGSCLCFYRWPDRRAHLFTYFTVSCSFDLLLSLCCDSGVSRVLFHLLPIYPRYTSSPYFLFVICQLCES